MSIRRGETLPLPAAVRGETPAEYPATPKPLRRIGRQTYRVEANGDRFRVVANDGREVGTFVTETDADDYVRRMG